VPEAWRTFVPLPAAGLRLQAFAVEPAAVTVTGLLVEPLLADVAESALRVRLARLESVEPLTVGLFLSGARPRPHASRMVTVAESLARAGHRAILFWGTGMLDASKVQFELRRRGIPDDAARVVWSRSRADETTRTAEVFASLDVMVAAAHERTNWAVGLGLPMFALLPHIGPFARENFDFASQQGVCLPLASSADAAAFGSTLDTLRRSGGLAEMARAGWGRHPINGAAVAARILADELAQVRTSVLS
jgi:hypothetical protein